VTEAGLLSGMPSPAMPFAPGLLPVQPGQPNQFHVTCPPGAGPGSKLSVSAPAGGEARFEVQVPEGESGVLVQYLYRYLANSCC
jgi:hypothetical protein